MDTTITPVPDDPRRLAVRGEFTIYHVQWLKQTLMQALQDGFHMDLDLSDVTEIDSAGLQLLALLKNESRAAGKPLRLVDHSPCVIDVLELCRLEGFFGDPVVIRPQEVPHGV